MGEKLNYIGSSVMSIIFGISYRTYFIANNCNLSCTNGSTEEEFQL